MVYTVHCFDAMVMVAFTETLAISKSVIVLLCTCYWGPTMLLYNI